MEVRLGLGPFGGNGTLSCEMQSLVLRSGQGLRKLGERMRISLTGFTIDKPGHLDRNR